MLSKIEPQATNWKGSSKHSKFINIEILNQLIRHVIVVVISVQLKCQPDYLPDIFLE